MSALLAAVLFCACVFLGNGKARVLRVRRQTLTAMEDDIRRLAERMELRPAPIAVLIMQFAPRTEAFWEIFGEKLGGEAPITELWKEAMEEAEKMHNGFETLSPEETAVLVDFGLGLDGIGLAAQSANAQNACKRLNQRIAALEISQGFFEDIISGRLRAGSFSQMSYANRVIVETLAHQTERGE